MYISLGPNQPVLDDFPTTQDGKNNRRFQASWYVHHPWLEYSKETNKAYCLPCFLFESKSTTKRVFSTEGFCAWKRVGGKECALKHHVGDPGSHHSKALKDWKGLSNPSLHIDKALNVQCSQQVYENRLRLKTSIIAATWLARQGCAFRGHDESTSSSNRGNFIEKVKSLASVNEEIKKVVLENAPKFAKYTSPDIQKEILNILANKVRMKIREEIGDGRFCILVDEAVDESSKEQMAIILRFVNREGFVLERFFEILSVEETTAKTLKREITKVLDRYNLEVGSLRGQGYDGASNMRGQWNGLQALFSEECPYAYFVHCFAHRLQLALVAAANEVQVVWVFFGSLGAVVNVLTASAKRKSELKSSRAIEVTELLATGDLESGQGANQTCALQRAGATRWSSHYNSVRSLIVLFKTVKKNLSGLIDNGPDRNVQGAALGAFRAVTDFEFVFILLLMDEVLGITNSLCMNLQRQSQDIVNAMRLVKASKCLLLKLRLDGWTRFLERVTKFCEDNEIVVPTLADRYLKGTGRICQQTDCITNEHYYKNDIFNEVVSYQLKELDGRFSDDMVDLLSLSLSLDPSNHFESFNIDDICTLATKFYPRDFTDVEFHDLRKQLALYESDIFTHPKFQNILSLAELCQVMYETRTNLDYFLVDRLIRLVLTLPVSTSTTERAFSAMKIIKTRLRNKMEDEFLADNMVINIERDIAGEFDIDSIIDTFYAIKNRRSQLK